MAQTGYTPILIYSSSTTTNAPAAGSLTNSKLGSELAINITDGKLFYKDNANAVQVIAWKTTPTTAGGTGLTSYNQGDLLYYNTGTTLTALAKNTSATRYLSNTGTSNNPAWAQVDLTNGVTGTLPTGNGGTNLTSFTANGVVYASSTSVLATGSAFTFDGTNVSTTGNFVVATSGKGIDFSATSSGTGTMTSELLSDYEEGTFTPTAYGLSTAGTTTYSGQVGNYTKIGNLVTVFINLSVTNMTGTGTLAIGGLPFTASLRSPGSIVTDSMDWVGGTSPVLLTETSNTYARIFVSGDNASWSVQTVETAWEFYACVTYKV